MVNKVANRDDMAQLGKLGKKLMDIVIWREFPFLDERGDCITGKLLGDGSQIEDGPGAYGYIVLQIGHSIPFLEYYLPVPDDGNGTAGTCRPVKGLEDSVCPGGKGIGPILRRTIYAVDK